MTEFAVQQLLQTQETLDAVARAICAETCAFRGEPPCWAVDRAEGVVWQPCDEPGCPALAAAAISAVRGA